MKKNKGNKDERDKERRGKEEKMWKGDKERRGQVKKRKEDTN